MNPFPAKLVRSRWLDIGLVPFCVFIIGLPVAKPDKVLSRSKKDNIKVARLDFLVGILPHFQRLLTRSKQRKSDFRMSLKNGFGKCSLFVLPTNG